MRIFEIESKQVFEIELDKSGENQQRCPVCSDSRKQSNQKKKPFSFNAKTGVGNCLNCGARFVLYSPFIKEKSYVVPEWKNITDLSDKAVMYFAGRGISQATLKALRVYSDQQYFAELGCESEAICFPYFRANELVNIKYRGAKKAFTLVKDAELIFWNFDALLENDTVVICEGESDLLSIYEAGFKNVISVPNGAKNTAYLDSCITAFDRIKKVVIVNDNDMAGIELRDELIRRLGEEKCYTVDLDTCKDANEYLLRHGGFELHNRINEAAPVPVSGIFTATSVYQQSYDLYMHGMPPGLKLNWPELDNCITWETQRLCVATGIPSHGKSEFVDEICCRMNALHGWRVGFFSPENYPIQYHTTKIISKISGKSCKPDYLSADEFEQTYQHINENFFWVYPEKDFTIESIIEKATQLVKMHGIKVMVFDPYNKFEHRLHHGENKTDYVGRFLDALIDFAKWYDVLVILVAHPKKMQKRDESSYEIPTLYDVSDSANFYNKADFGFTVYRDYKKGTTSVIVSKVKFKHLGSGGNVEYVYNYHNGRYEIIQDVNQWKRNSWLDGIENISESFDNSENSLTLQPNEGFSNCPF